MNPYRNQQLITYIGNKRLLIKRVEAIVEKIKKRENRDKLICLDLFSGTGVVGRMLKDHSSLLVVNDLENYSYITNQCYLSNKDQFNRQEFLRYREEILNLPLEAGLICQHYAPRETDNIKAGERVFYTRENALRIDTYRQAIDGLPEEMKKYFLGPLIYGASVHVNTGGVFKGFYKDKNTGIGAFGGAGANALSRILGPVELLEPVLSKSSCTVQVYREDANTLVDQLEPVDVAYLDPPYNQHPYGSNYFMLNLIVDYAITGPISPVSGIPSNWNRSRYNSKREAPEALEQLIDKIKAKYIILSYNSEGYLTEDDLVDILARHGKVHREKIKYNTYKGSRNLRSRSLHVEEHIFILEKQGR